MIHKRRRVIHFNVTKYPTAQWTAQQIIAACPWDTASKYLLRDRDGIYGSVFQNRVKNLGITEVKTYTTKPVAKSILRANDWKHSQRLPQSSNRIECQPFKVNNI
jgi:hypothetical protein